MIIAWCQTIGWMRKRLSDLRTDHWRCVWHCLNGTRFPSYWPILAASDQSPASVWSSADSRGPNWVFGHRKVFLSRWSPSTPTKHTAKSVWPLQLSFQLNNLYNDLNSAQSHPFFTCHHSLTYTLDSTHINPMVFQLLPSSFDLNVKCIPFDVAISYWTYIM